MAHYDGFAEAEADRTIRELRQALAEKEHELQQIREHEFQRGYREGEAAAKGALAEKEREIAKWKAAHDEMVARNRLLRDRPDLPADRIRAHDEWVEKYQRVLAQAVRFASTVEDCNWVANTDEWAAREFLKSPEAQAFLKERPCLARKI